VYLCVYKEKNGSKSFLGYREVHVNSNIWKMALARTEATV